MRFPRVFPLVAGAALVVACGGDIGPSNAEPTAAFTVLCEPLECTFTNLSTDPDGTLGAYAWDFGDDRAPATTRDATHTYAAPGRFTVTLTVTDNDGATATATEPVDVRAPNGAPTASFTASCTDLTCAFTDRSFDRDAGGRVASYNWDFGDNSIHATTRDAAHTYAAPGQFTVTLTVRDNDGATATATGQANPNLAPTASFTVSCTDLTCVFTDRSSDVGGSVTSYSWNFGDSRNSTEKSPEHTFESAGSYTVWLVVTDDQGATGNALWQVLVPPPDFTVSCSSLECTFTPQVEGFGGSLFWDFGDGATSTDPTPTHVYDVSGPTTFTVTLIVTDEWWQSYGNSHDITVSPAAARSPTGAP